MGSGMNPEATEEDEAEEGPALTSRWGPACQGRVTGRSWSFADWCDGLPLAFGALARVVCGRLVWGSRVSVDTPLIAGAVTINSRDEGIPAANRYCMLVGDAARPLPSSVPRVNPSRLEGGRIWDSQNRNKI